MAQIDSSQALLLLSILQEPSADKARERFLQFLQLEELYDQAIHDRLEDLIGDSVIRNQMEIELDTDVAIALLVVLKRGIRKRRGGQPKHRHEELQKRTLASIGKTIKRQLVAEGWTATQAHIEAAEQAAQIGQARGIEFKPGTIARNMDNVS